MADPADRATEMRIDRADWFEADLSGANFVIDWPQAVAIARSLGLDVRD